MDDANMKPPRRRRFESNDENRLKEQAFYGQVSSPDRFQKGEKNGDKWRNEL